MEINTFLEKLKQCKNASYFTGHNDLRVRKYTGTSIIDIINTPKKEVCPYCKTDLTKNNKVVKVTFKNEPQPLTIFEAELLFMMYVKNSLPLDYAKYHECQAGKEFIDSIKDIVVY